MKYCENCGTQLHNAELFYLVRGEYVCENCFMEHVEANYEDQYEDDCHDPMTIADDLGIMYRTRQSFKDEVYYDKVDHKIDDLKEGRW